MSVQKPDMRRAWANNGSVVPPDVLKIDIGWIAEKPPFQTDNWLQNRSDQYAQHNNIEGINQWDADSSYETNSIVKGTNGVVYQSNTNPNVGRNPVTDILGNWSVCPMRDTEISDLVWPVGSVYFSVLATNPATLFGFGVWARIAEGRTIIGQQTADSLFDVAEEVGGSKDAVIVSHGHTTNAAGSHNHGLGIGVVVVGQGNVAPYDPTSGSTPSGRPRNELDAGSHTHIINANGVSGANKNLPPYLVTYIWKRTA